MRKPLISAVLVAAGYALLIPILFNSARYRVSPLAAAFIPLVNQTE